MIFVFNNVFLNLLKGVVLEVNLPMLVAIADDLIWCERFPVVVIADSEVPLPLLLGGLPY